MTKNKKNQDIKLQFRFSPDAVDRLDSLKEKSRCSTRVDVIREALRIYEYLIQKDDEEYYDQRREVDACAPHRLRQPSPDRGKHRICDSVQERYNGVVWVGVDPRDHGPNDDDPHIEV